MWIQNRKLLLICSIGFGIIVLRRKLFEINAVLDELLLKFILFATLQIHLICESLNVYQYLILSMLIKFIYGSSCI